MCIEKKIAELGLELPPPSKPVGVYTPVARTGNLLFTAGQLPRENGVLKYAGKVGKDIDEAQGYEAAKLCALNCLSVIKAELGDLNNVESIVKVVGFVNSAPGFFAQPKVMNGASEILISIFGDKGRHARSAVGVAELPSNAACEVEMIVEIKQ